MLAPMASIIHSHSVVHVEEAVIRVVIRGVWGLYNLRILENPRVMSLLNSSLTSNVACLEEPQKW